MTSMRSDFEDILKTWGYNIFLQRRINPYNEETARFERVLEKHTVRSAYPRKNSLQTTAEEAVEGITHNFDLMFYFKHDAEPHRGDRIYEEYQGMPSDTARYLIDEALPLRAEKGQIAFWTVGATQETPKRE